jgi:hypothetical protein
MVPYTTLKIGEKEYKLRLSTMDAVELENKLGKNPLAVIQGAENNLPKLIDVIFMLHFCLQKYQHGIKLEDTYAIYDDFVDNGGTYPEMLAALVDAFEVSGYFKRSTANESTEENTEKN